MFKRILSGGRGNAGQAAHDFAVKNDIPYGIDISIDKKTEAGITPSVHQTEEIQLPGVGDQGASDASESDGTLVVTLGKAADGTIQEFDLEHGRPRLFIDLEGTSVFAAAAKVNRWLSENDIETLTVMGNPEGDTPDLYQGCLNLLQLVYHLNLIATSMPDPSRAVPHLPQTVDEALRHIEARLTLKDKVNLGRMGEAQLPEIYSTLGEYIMTRFGLLDENRGLMQSCRLLSGKDLSREEASDYILKALWKRLRNRYGLRIVK